MNNRLKEFGGLFLIVLLSISLYIGCNSNTKKSKEHFAIAKAYYNKKDYNNALKEVDNSFLLDSNNYDALILKAKIKYIIDFEEEAIQLLKIVLSKNYKSDTVNYLIGINYFSLSHYYHSKENAKGKEKDILEEGIKYFDNALALNPYYYESYIDKSKSLHNQEKYNEALIIINKALKFFPDSMRLVYMRGIEKNNLGDSKEALIDLNKAIFSNRLDSIDFASAYRFRGYIHADNGDLDSAIQDLSYAINYDPKNELVYASRGDFYRRKGLKDLACMDYRKSAELGMVSIYEKIKEYCGQ